MLKFTEIWGIIFLNLLYHLFRSFAMLLFLKKHSYDMVKLLIYQFAISIFGNALALATGETQKGLRITTSVFSVLFYLFLVYVMMWDLGTKDTYRFRKNEPGLTYLAGLYISLCASVLNFLFALFVMLGTLIPALGNLGAVTKILALLFEGMYTGILAIAVNGVTLNQLWFIYFLLPIPLIATASVAYIAGVKEFKVFGKK